MKRFEMATINYSLINIITKLTAYMEECCDVEDMNKVYELELGISPDIIKRIQKADTESDFDYSQSGEYSELIEWLDA